MRRFNIATEEEIKKGLTTDVYFERTKKVLEKEGVSKKVFAEVTTQKFQWDDNWGVLVGVYEALNLLEGANVNVYSMREGEIFRENEPVFQIEGDYLDFGIYETALLGILSEATGIATRALRCKIKAGAKTVLSFGIRRMHPAIAPMIDRAAYIGGADGVSGVLGAKIMGIKPSGTIPHALVILYKNQVEAWKAFDRVVEKDVPRIALVDTFFDEKTESIMAAENLEKIYGVRLDTPATRRGDIGKIAEEVRWELDIRGYKDVKIVVSGGIDENEIERLSKYPIDAFGVGTAISKETVDFALDIVEVEGKPVAKRGKFSGRKQVLRCSECGRDTLVIKGEKKRCRYCGGKTEELLKPVMKKGRIKIDFENEKAIRERVLKTAERLSLSKNLNNRDS